MHISCSLVNSLDKKEGEEEKNEMNDSPSFVGGEPDAYFLVTTLCTHKFIGQGEKKDRKGKIEELTLILLSRWSVRRERKQYTS